MGRGWGFEEMLGWGGRGRGICHMLEKKNVSAAAAAASI